MTRSHSGLPVSLIAPSLHPSLAILPPKCRCVQSVGPLALFLLLCTLSLAMSNSLDMEGSPKVGCWKHGISKARYVYP